MFFKVNYTKQILFKEHTMQLHKYIVWYANLDIPSNYKFISNIILSDISDKLLKETKESSQSTTVLVYDDKCFFYLFYF
jgi:hypothetical protein